MDSCASCGHELGVGRFCTNCGHPVGAPVPDRPDRSQFADEAGTSTPPPPTPAPALALAPPVRPDPRHRSRRPGWALSSPLGLLALVLVAGLGTWLLVGDDDAPQDANRAEQAADAQPREGRSRSEPSEPASEPAGSMPVEPAPPADLARFTEISAPSPAPASRDTSGDVVRYVATNLVDGSPTTCWRMAGDGTGESITFRFESPVRLTEVGLINGYAKRSAGPSGEIDWYAGNRRVRSVEWTFDDGTVVTQSLGDTTDLQVVGLDDVETDSVTVRLLAVSAPGTGPASRDYTAISDVRLVGTALT